MRDTLARVQVAVARHPKVLMTLLLITLLVASADPVAATDGVSGGDIWIDFLFESEIDTDGVVTLEDPGSANGGPSNP